MLINRGELVEAECCLQPLEAADLASLVELFTCPTARLYLGGPLEVSVAKNKSLDWIARSSDKPIWAVRDPSDSTFMGYILLDSHHDGHGVQEVSYGLLPRFWGRGLAIKALKLALHYAFSQLKLTRVVAETQAKNHRSIKLLERIGMLPEKRVMRFGEEQIIFSVCADKQITTK